MGEHTFVYSLKNSLTIWPEKLINMKNTLIFTDGCIIRGAMSPNRDPLGDTVSFVQEICSESPESHEKPSVSCHCERSEAISWPIWGLLRRLRRLAMTRMGKGRGVTFDRQLPEGKIHYPPRRSHKENRKAPL